MRSSPQRILKVVEDLKNKEGITQSNCQSCSRGYKNHEYVCSGGEHCIDKEDQLLITRKRLYNATRAGVKIVEDIAHDLKDALTEKRDLRNALFKLAFDSDVSYLAGDPSRWSSTIAYEALGGRIVDGVRVDTKEDLEKGNSS